MLRPLKRVLIANRGEIACRIARTLTDLGIESVAIYSEADKDSMHTRLATYCVPLKGTLSKDTYLNMPRLLEVLDQTGADAVHPGYGFLSENALFAKSVQDAGKVFIGPSHSAMDAMGDKVKAKKLMISHGVPVVPGSDGELGSFEELRQVADRIGFPLIIKASAGGGGRGMRVVTETEGLKSAYDACRREAESYFAHPGVFCERYVSNPRHIEFQVLFDNHGNGVHLFERDCSIQRRHQKLIEEAPSLFLDDASRMRLGAFAVDAGRSVGYSGVGTVEFICESKDQCYFMEMNTRIQVEHPVTEMITGVDLIKQQILVAQNHPLSFKQEDLKIKGWSFEARINAEDATQGFAPQSGRIEHLHLPAGPFVRMDTHIYPGYQIPDAYDSMIAKCISWGATRDEARHRLLRALKEFQLHGFKTTADFHERLCQMPAFIEGDFNTGFLGEHEKDLTQKSAVSELSQLAKALGAAFAQLK